VGWRIRPDEISDHGEEVVAQEKAPPIGLIPKFVRHTERGLEIVEAIQRYLNAGQRIPHEWVKELVRLDIYKRESSGIDEL
jgi:hypothetical protein